MMMMPDNIKKRTEQIIGLCKTRDPLEMLMPFSWWPRELYLLTRNFYKENLKRRDQGERTSCQLMFYNINLSMDGLDSDSLFFPPLAASCVYCILNATQSALFQYLQTCKGMLEILESSTMNLGLC